MVTGPSFTSAAAGARAGPGQDSTRGPASACRGSRLRGARVWSRCSASALSPLVMVSAPCRGSVRHGPMSRLTGPWARRLSCCLPADVAGRRVRGRRAAACCGERAGCVRQRQGSGACRGPELGRGAGAGLLGSGLKALAGAFVPDPTAEDVDGFARFQRASASAAVAAGLLKAGPRSTSALGPHSQHRHNPAAIGHALAQRRSDPPGRRCPALCLGTGQTDMRTRTRPREDRVDALPPRPCPGGSRPRPGLGHLRLQL